MDIGNVNKVASRKRLNADAEKLREKVTRETAKIIKLKVAQDTAYWDLKEKLQQVEGNHERLQQNMVEVQMQHEAISGQYQDELRLRPETLNKMSSTREICDVLEEYSERLKETLSRCKSDQTTLCEAYQKSGQLVRDIKLKQVQGEERSKQLVERLEEKIKLTSEHHNQLMQMFTASQQRVEAELNDTKARLSTALAQKDELLAALNELSRKLDANQLELQKKDESITSLQNDMKQLLHEFNLQANEMKNTLVKQEKELKETAESNEALKRALTNQEDFTKSMCDQNNQLQERIYSLEEEQATSLASIKDLETKLQECVTTNKNLANEVETLNAQRADLETEVKEKDKLLASVNAEIQDLKQQLSTLETEKTDLSLELASSKEECAAKSAQVEELTASGLEMTKKIADMENELTTQKESTTQKITELTETIESKDKELDNKASTIAQLMTDVKVATDARGKIEVTLQRLRKDTDAEREAAKEKERKLCKQVEQLEGIVRNKENELSKQMSIILEIRQEKERLQEKIQSMQNTIDNIQKELSGPISVAPCRVPPEQDDNANMFAPEKNKGMESPKLPTGFAKPRAEPKQLDSMLFSIFSDSSMDGDTLDPKEVNRRFEALSRGERVPPLPLGSLKRRAGVPAAQGGLKYKAPGGEGHLSLSQVKNDLKNKEKMFFKNKRVDPKSKKTK